MNRKTIIIILCVALLFIIGVPILINELYHVGQNIGGYLTYWDATDVLIYYGAVLGGCATLLAVFLTIKDGEKKRRLERKYEARKQRIAFVSSLLFDMLVKIDGSPFINRFRGEFKNWIKNPMDVYPYFEGAHKFVNVDINFNSTEKEVIADEIKHLTEYAKEYSEYLWDFHGLLIEWNDIEKDKESRNSIDKYISDYNNLKRQIDDDSKRYLIAEVNMLEKSITTLDVSTKSIEELESKQRELSVKIVDLCRKISALYEENYKDLRLSVNEAIRKLEQHLNDDELINATKTKK